MKTTRFFDHSHWFRIAMLLLCVFCMEIIVPRKAMSKIDDPRPVVIGNVKYRSHLNYVEAVDMSSDKVLWHTVLSRYVEPEHYNPDMKKDVQWNVILSIKLIDDTLEVRDRAERRYWVDRHGGKVLYKTAFLDCGVLGTCYDDETDYIQKRLGDVSGEIQLEEKLFKYLGVQAIASSTLFDSYTNRYRVSNVRDKRPETAWCTGKNGGIRESITRVLVKPSIVTGIRFIPGYAKSAGTFINNNRVAEVTITADNQSPFTVAVSSRGDLGSVLVNLPFKEPVNQVRMEITKIYPGRIFNDACISEMELDRDISSLIADWRVEENKRVNQYRKRLQEAFGIVTSYMKSKNLNPDDFSVELSEELALVIWKKRAHGVRGTDGHSQMLDIDLTKSKVAKATYLDHTLEEWDWEW